MLVAPQQVDDPANLMVDFHLAAYTAEGVDPSIDLIDAAILIFVMPRLLI